MADTKISALTSLTGANTASTTDVLAIVDTSATTTKKITRAELFDISDPTGGQIVFPTTQNASSNAYTFDDYREGTWTPVLQGTGGGPLTHSAQVGDYIKIGKLVHISGYVAISGGTPITGGVTIEGLPFNTQTKSNYFAVITPGNYSAVFDVNYTQLSLVINSNASGILVFENGNSQASASIPPAQIGTGFFLEFAGSYIAAA